MKRSWTLKSISDVFELVRTFTVNLTIVFVGLALLTIVSRQLLNRSVVIEPINVPASIAQKGYTSEIISQWIVDEINNIQDIATTQKKRSELVPDWERLDIEMPGADLSVQTIGRILREGLGILEKKITGEVIQLEHGYRMRLRFMLIDDNSYAVLTDDDVDQLIKKGALQSIKTIEPFTLASYYYAMAHPGGPEGTDDKERTEALEKMNETIDLCLKNKRSDDDPWAHNLRGVALARLNKHKQAIQSYELAIAADPNFVLPVWNWGTSLLALNRYGDALDKYREAISKDPELDPELPSKVLVGWGRELAGEGQVDKAIDLFKEALKREPLQADAYFEWGQALYDLASQSDSKSTAESLYRQAIEKYGESTKIVPDNDRARKKLSRASKALEDLLLTNDVSID